jgi:hypothetical protein
MAIAFVKNVGSATSTMSTTVVVTVPAEGCAIGNLLVAHEAGAGGTVTDSKGNTWAARVEVLGNIITQVISSCVVTVALVSGDTITCTSIKTNAAMSVEEWSGTGDFEALATAEGSSTTPSVALLPVAVGLVVGIVMAEGQPTVTEDSDTDGGSWVTLTRVGTGADRQTSGAYKTTTSVVTQTYNPVLSAAKYWVDSVLAWHDGRVPRFTSYPQLLAH